MSDIIQHPVPPQPDPEMLRQQRRRTRRQKANLTGCGCSIFSLLIGSGVMNLSYLPFYASLPVSLLIIPLCALLVRKTGKCKPLLYTVRAIGILLIAAPCMMTFLCLGFSKVPALYRVKRFLYREGVTNRFHSGVLMPEHLPVHVQQYDFHARVQVPAQDYSPDAVLRLYTDTEWLHTYEAKLAAEDGLMRIKRMQEFDDEPEGPEEPVCPKYLPPYLFDTRYITGDLQHAVFYLPQKEDGTPDRYAGAMIDYETGLLIVWI